jgi:CheY-like chemotaxis protein
MRWSTPEVDVVEDGGVIRALVVDDDADMRMLVAMSIDLSVRPVEVIAVSDGSDAIAKWRAEQPDVIVMDIRMPTGSGLDLAGAILAESPKQVIVLFSAYVEDGVIDLAEDIGVCEVLEKHRLRDLPTVLEECVRTR